MEGISCMRSTLFPRIYNLYLVHAHKSKIDGTTYNGEWIRKGGTPRTMTRSKRPTTPFTLPSYSVIVPLLLP